MLKSKKTVLTGFLTAIIVISGFIRIPMYPVPVSMVFLTINFISLSFDRKISVLSILLYIGIGLSGLPVFSGGGGIGYIFSPTFGYLAGFVVICICTAAFKKINLLNEHLFLKNLVISVVNMFIVYFCGAGYGYLILKFSLKTSIDIYYILIYYVAIFVPGDLLSSVVSSYISKRVASLK